jgi:hypothetical protein
MTKSFGKASDDDYSLAVKGDIIEMVNAYGNLLKKGDYDGAFTKYWSASDAKDKFSGKGFHVSDYTVTHISSGRDPESYYLCGFDNFGCETVPNLYTVDVRYYHYFDILGTEDFLYNGLPANTDRLEVIFENGQWKILSARVLELGYKTYED